MDLNERKLNILRAVVKDYIETAEAVGSRTISKRYDLGVSPATIRNEMADLEELGYLIQPHTSAGRIPSQKGYELYVNTLMKGSELTLSEKEMINDCVEKNIDDIQTLIHQTSKLLSHLTNYTTLAVTEHNAQKEGIKHVQLVSLDDKSILVVIVNQFGDIKKSILETKVELDQNKLNIISTRLSQKLSGRSIKSIDDILIGYIKYEISEHSNLIDELLHMMNSEHS